MGVKLGKIDIKNPIAVVRGSDMLQQYVKANNGCHSLFEDFEGTNLDFIKDLDTSNVTDMRYMFSGCRKLTSIPQLDTSKVTDMSGMFMSCELITTIPELDTSNVAKMQSTFQNCYKLESIPQLNTSKLYYMYYTFCNCYKLTTIPQIDTSNVTNMSSIFSYCSSLTTIPLLDTSKVVSIDGIVKSCTSLTTIDGFKDLGKSYSTNIIANNSSYTLDLSSCTLLTHNSLMNVINNLYDIATKGCSVQKLVLGSTNLAKLTAEEIAIATNKGWTVS